MVPNTVVAGTDVGAAGASEERVGHVGEVERHKRFGIGMTSANVCHV